MSQPGEDSSPLSESFAGSSPAAVSAVAHVVVDSIDEAQLSTPDHHHVVRVLRARPGETVTVTDGRGAWRIGVVPANWSDPSIELAELGPVHRVERSFGRSKERCVAIALAKADKPETAVQKLTELGIDRVVLLNAAHSVVKWDADKVVKNLLRLRTIAREAVMQSRGVWLPSIDGVFAPSQFVESEQRLGRRVAVAQFGGEHVTAEVDTILIGPEGGWSSQELGGFQNRVQLGHNVLRAETAAIAAGVLLAHATDIHN